MRSRLGREHAPAKQLIPLPREVESLRDRIAPGEIEQPGAAGVGANGNARPGQRYRGFTVDPGLDPFGFARLDRAADPERGERQATPGVRELAILQLAAKRVTQRAREVAIGAPSRTFDRLRRCVALGKEVARGVEHVGSDEAVALLEEGHREEV